MNKACIVDIIFTNPDYGISVKHGPLPHVFEDQYHPVRCVMILLRLNSGLLMFSMTMSNYNFRKAFKQYENLFLIHWTFFETFYNVHCI